MRWVQEVRCYVADVQGNRVVEQGRLAHFTLLQSLCCVRTPQPGYASAGSNIEYVMLSMGSAPSCT
jgi:hypothetical protein